MAEMECVCGELLKSDEPGGLYKLWEEHKRRDDHRPTPAQWATAYEIDQKNREKTRQANK